MRSLYCWEESDLFLQALLYELKGGKNSSAFLFLAEKFFQQNLYFFSQDRRSLVFVPAPARGVEKGRELVEDHASKWARCLAELYGGNCCFLLKRQDEQQQKELSVEERSEKRLELIGEIEKDAKMIFCDDVITSGSTAKAAFCALREPEGFEVWTIAFRPKWRSQPLQKTTRHTITSLE